MPLLTVNVSDEFHEKLQTLARDMECTVEQFHLLALGELYTEERANADALLDGLRDIEAGRVVPHEAVVAWLDSLGTDKPQPVPLSTNLAQRRAS